MIRLRSVPFLSWSLQNCPVFPVPNYKALQLSSAPRKALKAKEGCFSVFSRLPTRATVGTNSFVRGQTHSCTQWHEDGAPSWLSTELGRFQISPSEQAPSRPPMPPGARTYHLFLAIRSALPGLPFQGHTPPTQDERSSVVVLPHGWLCPSPTPTAIWQCLETFLAGTLGGCSLHLAGRSWDAAKHFSVHRRANGQPAQNAKSAKAEKPWPSDLNQILQS